MKHLEVLEGAESRLHLFQIDLLGYNYIVVAVSVDQGTDPEVREHIYTFICICIFNLFVINSMCCVYVLEHDGELLIDRDGED